MCCKKQYNNNNDKSPVKVVLTKTVVTIVKIAARSACSGKFLSENETKCFYNFITERNILTGKNYSGGEQSLSASFVYNIQ